MRIHPFSLTSPLVSIVRITALSGVCVGTVGCVRVDCGPPSQIDGEYDVRANVVTETATSADKAAFALLDSPVNGRSSWKLSWDASSDSAVEVVINDQSYTAQAEWDSTVCGNFVMAFSGTFDGRDGSSHDFRTAGDFSVFGDQLEGGWSWSELWSNGSGKSGSFDAEGRVSGERVRTPESADDPVADP